MAGRKSAFREVGLFDADNDDGFPEGSRRRSRPQNNVRFESNDDVHLVERYMQDDGVNNKETGERDTGVSGGTQKPASHRRISSIMYKLGAALVLISAAVSLLQSFGFVGHDAAVPIQGVSGGAIPEEVKEKREIGLERRDTSSTKWCFKWAQQSAIVNGTLYLYGGQLATEPEQTVSLENTWTHNFVSIDLTKTWATGDPALKGLQEPTNVPAVALGYLWSSPDSIWLYGGEYSWKPPATPAPFSTWEYNIASGDWIEHSNPVTSAGLSAPDGGVPVQRVAEGAGVNVPTLGRGFVFGGHLDAYTTPGWEVWIPRVYLRSLLEFTFPGYSNPEVDSLKNGKVAGSDGVYRNITQGGGSQPGFTSRADGILTFVPGFGDEGILVALAGGTNITFTALNIINVYDIATSTWYDQSTSGEYPSLRVNPCSVVAAAPDGSSYNIYMFGGQDLLPYGSQQQKNDMWILSLPSFIWTKVDQGGQSVPYGRSGATCNIWDGQMVMVGGYTGNNALSCEYPAVYVFNLSSLIWEGQFTSLSNSDFYGPTDFLNQQPEQLYTSTSEGGLEGSYGYTVPDVIAKQIGGGPLGGATITRPVQSATAGPMKTGSAIIYTTQTAAPGSFGDSGGSNGSKIAAIVVGVVCGVAFIIICYLLFCLFVYRKQLALYKRHVELAQAQARGEKPSAIPALWATDSAQEDSDPSVKPVGSLGETGSNVGSNNNRSRVGSHAPQGSFAGQQSGTQSARRSSEASTTEDLLGDQEPTFVGVMLNPRRSLKVINRD